MCISPTMMTTNFIVYISAKYKHINILKYKYCYSLSQTLDITYGTFILTLMLLKQMIVSYA